MTMTNKYLSIPKLSKSDQDWFWSNCTKLDSGCWKWGRSKTKDGHGTVWLGKLYLAHRVAYCLYYGEIDSNLLICHKCNNAWCINPEHLYQGTLLTNANDRCNDVENTWNISDRDKDAIRWLRDYLDFDTQYIALLFNITDVSVSNICESRGKNNITRLTRIEQIEVANYLTQNIGVTKASRRLVTIRKNNDVRRISRVVVTKVRDRYHSEICSKSKAYLRPRLQAH